MAAGTGGAAGPLGGEVLATTRRRWTVRVVLLLFVLPIAFGCIGGSIDLGNDPDYPRGTALGLGAFGAAVALFLVLTWVSEQLRRVVVTSTGIARRGLGGWRALRWEDVEELCMWVRSSRGVPRLGALVAVGQLMTPGRAYEDRVGHAAVVRISGAGQVVRFTSLDRGWLPVFRLAESRTRERLAAVCARRLAGGEVVQAGALRLDHTGASIDAVTVPWSELGALRLHEGYLHLTRKGGQPGPHAAANGVANTAALCAAVEAHLPTRRS